MKNLFKLLAIPAVLLCAACGSKGALRPQAGNDFPVKAYAQTDPQTAERLLRTSPQARPSREAEILRRSTIRTEDPFDLPPESMVTDFPDDLEPLDQLPDTDEPSDK